jgi:hypothetical protein
MVESSAPTPNILINRILICYCRSEISELATFPQDLLVIFMLWFHLAFWWPRGGNWYSRNGNMRRRHLRIPLLPSMCGCRTSTSHNTSIMHLSEPITGSLTNQFDPGDIGIHLIFAAFASRSTSLLGSTRGNLENYNNRCSAVCL